MNEPKLRFPEFTDDWKSCKVSEVAEKTFGGGTPKTSNETFWIGEIPWIQSSDLVDGNLFDINPKKYISQEAINKSAAKLIPENSIAVVTRVGVGKLMFVPFSYATSQDFLSLSGLKTEPQFTSYSLYKRLQQDLCKVQGTSIKGITKDELLIKEIMVPSYEEQKKIGECLHSVDTLIQSAKKELEGYRELKQGMLQKMFPKKGEKVPEIRFLADDGSQFLEWEEKKIDDLFYKVNERNNGQFGKDKWISVAKMYYQDEDKVTSNNIDTRTYVMRVGDMSFEGHPNKEFKYGRFVVNDIGDGIISELFPIYRHKENYILKYWKYAIQVDSIMQKIYRKSITSSGASSNKLDDDDFKRQSILIPCLEEQKKIGEYFQNLDNLIASQQQEIEGYKELKKGLLQQMFC